MPQTVSIGNASFESIRRENCFQIDMDEAGLSEEKGLVKSWYDGFIFGQCKDMYNPWSITNFLDKRELQAYGADTCSNRL